MDNIKVEVVDAPVLELFFTNWLDTVVVVEGVPKLRNDEKIGALHKAVFDGAGNTLTRFHFIAVICGACQAWKMVFLVVESNQYTACAVEETVTTLDGVVDLICTGIVVYFPQPEANKRHGVAAVEFDRWRSHVGVGPDG